MNSPALHFLKLEGCGNCFLVASDPNRQRSDWPELGVKLMDRHFGVGADGLMVVCRPPEGSSPADFEVLMFNPDGSPMGMCGNGTRCVARYLVLEGMIPVNQERVSFLVSGRLIVCRLLDEARRVEVDMGQPSFDPRSIPVLSDEEVLPGVLSAAGREFRFAAVSMGNPHCVIFVSDFAGLNCTEFGPLIERHGLFPQRTNVEFVKRVDQAHLEVKVWERGAGLTLACGTGACAALAAGVRLGLCAREVQVQLPGGRLAVRWDQASGHIFMTGPAQEICRGVIYEECLKGV